MESSTTFGISVSELARLIGAKPQRVSNWRRRGVAVSECPSIERATHGAVTVEQLRPDVRWVRVPDPAWPHPHGRPCIDVAGPVDMAQATPAHQEA
jgi:hypothetical protein